MRVATINIWGRSGDWPARREVLRRAIADLAPDVLGLQETFVLPGYDQVAELTDGMNVVHQRHRAPDGGGISIATPHSIRVVHEIDLHINEGPRDFAAGALMVELAEFPVLFVNHFPSWRLDQESEREQQAVMVAAAIERMGVEHVVVAGDMDAEPSSTSIRFWTGRTSLEGISVAYVDAWEAMHRDEEGETVNFAGHQSWPFRRIDYILVRCEVHAAPSLPITSCSRWLDSPVDGVWASDHFGVVVDLLVA